MSFGQFLLTKHFHRRRKAVQLLAVCCSIFHWIVTAPLYLTQTPPDQQHIQDLLRKAQEAEKTKDYDRAAAAYLSVQKLLPKWPLVYQNLGIIYHLQSRYSDAIDAFQKALELDPELWGSHLFLGMAYYRTNQFSKAVPQLQKAAALNPQLAEGEARFWLGSSYLALEDFQQSVREFRRLAELKPAELEPLYNLAQAYSRYSSVLFKEIGQIGQESPAAHRLQAEWYESQEKLDRAIEEYEQVAKLDAAWEGIHLALGNLHFRQGNLERAADEYGKELCIAPQDKSTRDRLETVQQKLRKSPTGASSQVTSDPSRRGTLPFRYSAESSPPGQGPGPSTSLGIEQFRAGAYAEAAKTLKETVNSNPADARSLLYLARSYFALGSYAQSVEILQTLEKVSGRDPELLYWLGKCYHELAALTLDRMIAVNPTSYRVQQMSGELLEEKTQYAGALQAYQQALKAVPDLAGIHYAIGNVYWKMQKLDEALPWLKEELVRNPYHALANFRTGSIYMAKGNSDSAIPYLEQAVQANPGMLAAQQELGKAYMAAERYQEAIARFQMVAAGDVEDDGIHYLLSGAYKKVGKSQEANAELQKFGELRQKKADRDRKYLETKARNHEAK